LFSTVFKNIVNVLYSRLLESYPDLFKLIEKCSLSLKHKDLKELSEIFDLKSRYYKQIKDVLAFHETYHTEYLKYREEERNIL